MFPRASCLAAVKAGHAAVVLFHRSTVTYKKHWLVYRANSVMTLQLDASLFAISETPQTAAYHFLKMPIQQDETGCVTWIAHVRTHVA